MFDTSLKKQFKSKWDFQLAFIDLDVQMVSVKVSSPMAFVKSKATAWGCCLKISGFNPQQPSRWSIIDAFQGIILTTTPSYIFCRK